MRPVVFDLAIVGAGIVGAACAVEATAAGLSTAVLDEGHGSGGATAAAMGHLVALDGSPEELALCRFSLELWRAARFPPEVRFRPVGTLWVAEGESQLSRAAEKRSRLSAGGVEAIEVDAAEVVRREPALRPDLAGGLLVPGDCLVDPTAASRHLLRVARDAGATLLFGYPATSVADGTVRRRGAESVAARHVIVAAGTGSIRLVPAIPVRPRKGQLVRFRRPGPPLHHQVVELAYSDTVRAKEPVSVAFNAQPAENGDWIVGASRSWGRSDTAPEPAVTDALCRRASRFLPGLDGARPDRTWAGLRPAMPDHRPWIGAVPGFDRVSAAVGHEGLGITCSLGTARLVVDELLGRPSEIPRQPYLPSQDRALWPDPSMPEQAP